MPMGLPYQADNLGRSRRRMWTPYESPVHPASWLDISDKASLTIAFVNAGSNTNTRAAGSTSCTCSVDISATTPVGCLVTFGGRSETYRVTSMAGTTMNFTPALTTASTNGEAIARSQVSDIADRSKNGVGTTNATTTTQPFYSESLLGGRPAISCMSNSRRMSWTGAGVPLTDFSVFAVAATTANGSIFGGANSSVQCRSNALGLEFLKQNVASVIISTAKVGSGAQGIWHGHTANANNGAGSNGTINTNTGATSYAGNILYLFHRNGTEFWTGSLSELIIYPAVLDATQRENNLGYLAHKWGTESTLITSNQFRVEPPVR